MESVLDALRSGKNFLNRNSAPPLSTIPPPADAPEYRHDLAAAAARIVYPNPVPAPGGNRLYVVNVAAMAAVSPADYDALLPYALQRLPAENELLEDRLEYKVVVFAGDGLEKEPEFVQTSSSSSTGGPAQAGAAGAAGPQGQQGGADPLGLESALQPGTDPVQQQQPDGQAVLSSSPVWSWLARSYKVLPRILRKRLMRMYIIHERSSMKWFVQAVNVIISPKFRRKVSHFPTLSALATVLPLESVLIPPIVLVQDRTVAEAVILPGARGPRSFAVSNPLPRRLSDGRTRLPRVLREATQFLLLGDNLKTEGIFRVPSSVRMRSALRGAYDRGHKYIIWKEQDRLLPIPDFIDGHKINTAELDPRDWSGSFMAASLIKYWYFSLKRPLIPHGSYPHLREIGGRQEDRKARVEQLATLFGPTSADSPLPLVSRELLTRHLFPLLSRTASLQEFNKMPPKNLAICVGPGMVNGPELMEDAQVLSILQEILTDAIELWAGPDGLAAQVGVSGEELEVECAHPGSIEDFEDPEDVEGEADPAVVLGEGEAGRQSGEGPARPGIASGPPSVLSEPRDEGQPQSPALGVAAAAAGKSSPAGVTSPMKRKPVPGLAGEDDEEARARARAAEFAIPTWTQPGSGALSPKGS